MIGLFTLIKDEDLTVICETQDELDSLNKFSDNFMRLRKLATIIDNYIHNAILSKFPTNNGNLVHAISEYTKWLLAGMDEEKVTQRITIGYFASDIEHCVRESKTLVYDLELSQLLQKLVPIQQECLKDRASILALEGLRFVE